MKPVPNDALGELLAEAGKAEIPPPDETIFSAELAAHAANNRRRRRRMRLAAAVSIAAAACALLAWSVTNRETTRFARTTLPTGDVLVQPADGAISLGVESLDDERRLRLEEGEVLFDVAALRSGESFVVSTPFLEVAVVGTVFAVSVHEEGVIVEVYEGQIDVRRDGESIAHLGANDRYGVGPGWRDHELALAGEGERRGRRRTLAEARAANEGVDEEDDEEDDEDEDEDEDDALHDESVDERIAADEERAVMEIEAPPEGQRTPEPTSSSQPSDSPRRRNVATDPTLAEVRAWIEAGRVDDAHRAALSRPSRDAAWEVVLGDVCRLRRDAPCAADAYDRAALMERPSRATQSGFLAAEIRLRQLRDPAGALASLDAAGSASPDSPIEERALVLKVQALRQLSRSADAERSARRYLLAFPSGPARRQMQELLDGR